MKIKRFHIDGPCLITRPVHRDDRGFFTETYNAPHFAEAFGFSPEFVQDNLSHSHRKDTLRGLHLQVPPFAQSKLITCLSGNILDIVIDVRRGSPTFGQSLHFELANDDGHSLWIPEGFLHGFITQTDNSIVSYKVTAPYNAQSDTSVNWNDPTLNLDWKLEGRTPIVSNKDVKGMAFQDFQSPFHV